MTPTVILADANVLFSRVLRDHLMYAALDGLIDLRWSPAILDEMERNLVVRKQMPPEQAALLRDLMESALPFATTELEKADYARVAHLPLPDEDDRHVIAAALAADANILCTANIRDFPPPATEGMGIVVTSPDELLRSLVIAFPIEMIRVHQACVANLRAATNASTLAALERAGAPLAASALNIARGNHLPAVVECGE